MILALALLVAPPDLTLSQHKALVAACNAGHQYGLCETTMAVVLQESSACVDLVGDDGTSFGCGQLQVATARKYRPGITARQLTRNRDLNLRITAENLADCKARFRTRWRTVLCHASPKSAKEMTEEEALGHPYVQRIVARLAFIRSRYGAN